MLREANSRYAYQSQHVCGSQWQDLLALPSRLAAKHQRFAGIDSGDDCHVWRTSAGVFKAQGDSISTTAAAATAVYASTSFERLQPIVSSADEFSAVSIVKFFRRFHTLSAKLRCFKRAIPNG